MRIENFIDFFLFIWARDFIIYSETKVNFVVTVELILRILDLFKFIHYLFQKSFKKPKSEKESGGD